MNLIKALQERGYSVSCIAKKDSYSEKLQANNCEFHEWKIIGSSKNPLNELKCVSSLRSLLRKANPDLVLCFTIKPNLYTSILWGGKKPVINNITGLGTAFISSSKLFSTFIKAIYRFAFRNSFRVFFQNPDDAKLFIDSDIVNPAKTKIIPGSGIDINRFVPAHPGSPDGKFRFLLIARLLKEKGVLEYIEAAKTLSANHQNVVFQLLGETGADNPSAISKSELEDLIGEHSQIEYLGVSDDVRQQIADVDCVVLPSYREGVPRTMLEAAAMGKPLITSNAVGCREVVEEGVNGFLCKVKDSQDLAAKMEIMLNLADEKRAELGQSSRAMAVEKFDEKIVTGHYLDSIDELSWLAQ